MINAIIIDESQDCINRLSSLLTAHFEDSVTLVGASLTAADGLDAIQKLRPDLLFLNIDSRDKTGFDLLEQIDEINFEIIFMSREEKHAIKAFRLRAIDYLLKPIHPGDLKQAIDTLREKMAKDEAFQKLDTLVQGLKTIHGQSKRICVPVISGLVFLQVNDIVRCHSDINYTNIYLKDRQKLTVAKTLKEFEEKLGDYNFYRLHNSHLVNLSYIKSYNKGNGGYVTMIDNSQIKVSTRRKEEFLKKLTNI
jgi:two-component system LytT family response regulator